MICPWSERPSIVETIIARSRAKVRLDDFEKCVVTPVVTRLNRAKPRRKLVTVLDVLDGRNGAAGQGPTCKSRRVNEAEFLAV